MKMVLAILLVFAVKAAQAHQSLAPHEHPHGASALPGFDMFMLAVLAAGLLWLAFEKFRRTFASSFRGAPKARTRNPEAISERASGFRVRRFAPSRNDEENGERP
jgi:hypothetical protein